MSTPSVLSLVLRFLIQITRQKAHLHRIRDWGEKAKPANAQPTSKLYQKHRITRHVVNGCNVWMIAPKQAAGDAHILYLHGGVYIVGFSAQHWQFISNLVTTFNCTVTAPDYPLAPQAHAEDNFTLVLPLYRELLALVGHDHLTVMGDSAGGGMTLALAQRLRDEGIPQPSRLVLLSPWLDVTMTNPAIKAIERVDPFLDVPGLKEGGRMYAGAMDPADPCISPINASVRGLAPITMLIGTHDVLLADCRKLKAQAEAEDVSVDYHEFDGMLHVWMLFPIPEARQAMNLIRLGRDINS